MSTLTGWYTKQIEMIDQEFVLRDKEHKGPKYKLKNPKFFLSQRVSKIGTEKGEMYNYAVIRWIIFNSPYEIHYSITDVNSGLWMIVDESELNPVIPVSTP